MASEFDPTEFVDSDFQAARKAAHTTAGGIARAPSREEVETKVAEVQQKLAELRRIQDEKERERAGLEETRRRQMEFQTGRQEAIQNLTRGVGLLEEAEFEARRDAEQMGKALEGLREALAKVETTNEAAWTKERFSADMTRDLTIIENARMEWNAARLKFPVLSGHAKTEAAAPAAAPNPEQAWPGNRTFGQWCKLGLAFTWPLAIVALLALGALGVVIALLLQPPYHR